jgi:sigma-E factor negative regulatory protein RseB
MRHGLLLTAVATVTVPGALAVLGVVGHDHVAAGAGVAVTAGAAVAVPFPVAPATAPASVRNNRAGQQRAAGGPVTVFSRVTARQQALGLQLLNEAADAGLATSYDGTEQLSQSSVDGPVLMTSEVWHQGGGRTVVRSSASASSSAPATAVASSSPEGVFGVTKALVTLLGQNYVAAYEGSGTVAGRPAVVVAVYRFDGQLAAQYWLDRTTMLPLRRELFDTSGQVISEDSFTQVSLTAKAATVAAGADSRVTTAGAAQATSAWVTAASPTSFRASLAVQGWPLPASVTGGLPLYTAASAQTGSGELVDLEYSDGLYVVSLFVQRGNLAASLPGWQPAQVAGQPVFVSGHTVAWARAGFVYTVIADAPPATVSQVVGNVPGSETGGVLDRLGRGLARLVRMANPFG